MFASDDRTVVVHVDEVLQAPESFAKLAGSSVTLRLADGAAPLRAGDSESFFANGVAFGESVALQEVGRLATADVRAQVVASAGELALASLQRAVDTRRVREHASGADAIVLGRVVALRRAAGPPLREHDPDLWIATLEVDHVERGDVAGPAVDVLFPNSADVRWQAIPKPRPAQDGLWILHATEGEERELAPFALTSPDDLQEPQALEALR